MKDTAFPSKSPKSFNADHKPVETELFVTYGTGGTKSPASHKVLSLLKFHKRLLTKYQVETQALNELWHPFTIDTRRTRQRQHKLIETTFPFVVAGALFDKEADAANEEDDWSGWQTPSGLAVLSFTYLVARDNEVVTICKRMQLQERLKSIPLLGPSVVNVFKAPGDCLLYALVVIDPRRDYWGQVRVITRYLYLLATHTRLKLGGQSLGGDFSSAYPHSVGYDPHAYLRPRPAEGYPMFPVEEALAKIAEFERLNKPRTVKGKRIV